MFTTAGIWGVGVAVAAGDGVQRCLQWQVHEWALLEKEIREPDAKLGGKQRGLA
jgi:hypothetical protein